jgi:DNA-binding MarR family transcriptional regulator
MKSFPKEMNSASVSTSDRAAALLMDVIPLIMNCLRAETCHHMPELSMPQLRTLIFLYRHEDASVSQVADYVSLKLPSMSKTINALVVRKLVISRASPEDRRCVRLRLSSRGVDELMRARRLIEARLVERLAVLGSGQQAGIAAALESLRPLFAGKEASGLTTEK